MHSDNHHTSNLRTNGTRRTMNACVCVLQSTPVAVGTSKQSSEHAPLVTVPSPISPFWLSINFGWGTRRTRLSSSTSSRAWPPRRNGCCSSRSRAASGVEDSVTTQLEECVRARMVTTCSRAQTARSCLMGTELRRWHRGARWRDLPGSGWNGSLGGRTTATRRRAPCCEKQGATLGNASPIAREGSMASEPASPILATEESGMASELFWRDWTGLFINNSQI
jgi:hypothetical protein